MHPLSDLKVTITDIEMVDLQGRAGDPVRRPSGSILMGEGETPDHVLYLQKGHVKVVSGDPPRIVAIRGPGDLLGEMGPILMQPRSATIVAIEEVLFLNLLAQQWLDFLAKYPRAALAQQYALAKRLTEITTKTVESSLRSEQKMAKAIIELYSSGVGRETPTGTLIRVQQKELGDIAGVSLDTVKPIIRRFKAAGLVSTGRQSFTVTNPDTLSAIGRGEASVS